MSGGPAAVGQAAVRLARVADAATVAEIYNQGITWPGGSKRIPGGSRYAWPRRRAVSWAVPPSGPTATAAATPAWASSVYIHRDARGQGVGRLLLARLLEEARGRGDWKLLSRVFPSNTASLGVCRSLGFRLVGTYERHGCLDGRWLDVVIVERLIAENQP